MITLDGEQQAARDWFESLRDPICLEFEAIERENGSDACFTYTPWDRQAEGVGPSAGGGGLRGVMKGRVFEKVGVNVSSVGGTFDTEFGKTIHAADKPSTIFATGIRPDAQLSNPLGEAVNYKHRL